MLGYTYSRLIELLAVLHAVSAEEAEQQLIGLLHTWQVSGLIKQTEKTHG